MNSLRRRLALALIAGYALLLGAGGWAVYHFTSAALTRQFDESLLGKATTLTALLKRVDNQFEFNFPDRAITQPGTVRVLEYFQLWKIGGDSLHRSITLGNEDLPRRYGPLAAPDFFDLEIPGGIPGRAVGIRFPFPSKAGQARGEKGIPEIGLVAASGTYELDEQIASLGYTILLTGAVTLLASLFVVDLILWGGLAKLSRVTEQARRIGVGSLQKRFPTDGMTAELKPICLALNELLARLEQSFTEINQYAGKVAHELRTPLAILRLKIEQGGSRIAPELAEELHAEIHQIAHVVNQSLLIARAEQGRVKVELREFDLAALLAEATEDFSLIAKESDRQLRLEIPHTSATVCADPQHTRQIIHNLLSNAWKHGHGDVWLHLHRQARRGWVLTIINPVAARTSAASAEGLGLRVVDTLLALQPTLKCRRRIGEKNYAVRIVFSENRTAPKPRPASAPN